MHGLSALLDRGVASAVEDVWLRGFLGGHLTMTSDLVGFDDVGDKLTVECFFWGVCLFVTTLRNTRSSMANGNANGKRK